MKGVGGILGRLLLAFLQYSDIVISRGATTFRDEVVGITWLLIERSHLQTYSSSMAENFFGMKRAGVLRIGNEENNNSTSAAAAVSSSLRKAMSSFMGGGGGGGSSSTGVDAGGVTTASIMNTSAIQDHDCNKVFGSDVVFVDPMGVAAATATTSAGMKPPKSVSLLMGRNQYLICLLQLGVAPYLLTKLTNYYKYYTSDNPDVIEERMQVVREYLREISAAKADEQSLIEANSTPARALNGATNGGGIVVESSDILARVRANKHRAVLWAKIKFVIYRTAVKLLVALFPLVNMANQGLRAFFLAAYALERTPYFTLLQRVGQVGIRRVQMQDRMIQAGASKAASSTSSSALQRFFIKAGAVAVPLMFLIVRYQGWRRDQQNAGTVGGEGGLMGGGSNAAEDQQGEDGGPSDEGDLRKIPPPPEATASAITIATATAGGGGASASSPSPTTSTPGAAGEGEEVAGGAAKRGTCPVCTNPTTNPAVLIVSGVVGCFTCLHSYTTDNKKCPSTGLPCTTVHVRRLYE